MAVNELLAIQGELIERIQKPERNFKKSPKVRLQQKQYIETRLQSLEELWTEFKSGHRLLVPLISTTDKKKLKYFEEDHYDLFEEQYTTYKTILTVALNSFEKNNNTSEQQNDSSNEVKLPRILIPTFSGKYDEWQSFYDMFISLVHDNKSLSNVQKLHYLKSSLSGEPEKLLRNFATTGQNYTEAWSQLIKRYNNKRYNVHNIMKALFSQRHISIVSANNIKQLLDTTTCCIKSLKNHGVEMDDCDVFIVYIVVSKLDEESHKLWEQQLSLRQSDELPSWSLLVDFLESRFRSLEMLDTGKQVVKSVPNSTNKSKHVERFKTFHNAVQNNRETSGINCLMCNGQHFLYHCSNFEQKSVKERADFVQTKGLCFNCMSPTHVANKCRQSSCCRKCGRRHHTMLHFDKDELPMNIKSKESYTKTHLNDKEKPQMSTLDGETRVVANFSKGEIRSYNVLLATAMIKASSCTWKKYVVRALLDQGSQASFVSEATVQLLGLKRTPINGVVSGLGDGHTRIKHMVSFRIEARHNPEISFNLNAYVLGTLTSMLPSSKLPSDEWFELDSLQLADPNYAQPGKIDVLLGAEIYGELLLNGIIKNPHGNLIEQNTVFGWVLSGQMSKNKSSIDNEVIGMHLRVNETDWLKQFWEIEAEPNSIEKKMTKEEIMCEEFYDKTTVRNKDGRFVVRLPFKTEDSQSVYGESRDIAKRKLLSLERRLSKNLELRKEYENVMDEYLTLDHIALVDEVDVDNNMAVYLPHHAVVREDKETTKVRVVYNASSPGTNGISLNDDLLVGPKLQQDLILIRWRTYPICIVADIIKMYRQVLVHEEDTNFQRVLWRKDLEGSIQHYKLLTLTFGTACAPYLAVKTLQRLAEEEKLNYPVVAEITKRDYYMDDLMTGCETESEAVYICEEMSKLMESGGFQLQKWSSNNENLLKHIDKDKHHEKHVIPIKGDN